jgi:hypothetical protein
MCIVLAIATLTMVITLYVFKPSRILNSTTLLALHYLTINDSFKIMFIFVPILVAILLILNVLLAAHRPDSEKVTAYECGSLLFTDKLDHHSVFNTTL